MKKHVLFIGVILFMVFSFVAYAQATAAPERIRLGDGRTQFYSFISSSAGGTWYTMVGGAISLFNEYFEGARFSIEASGGSVENTRRLARGEVDFGIAYSSHIYEAMSGTGLFEGEPPNDNIRVVARIFISPHKFVTLQGFGITSLSDMEGRTVSLGAAGSGTSDNSRRTLRALGINVNEVEMMFSDAARALQDGHIAALGQGGAPAAGIVELAATRDIHIIPFSEEELRIMVELNPYFAPGELPAHTYQGQPEAVPVFTFSVYWIAHRDVPDQVVYESLRLAASEYGLAHLSTVHRQWATLSYSEEDENILGLVFHPGALAYWRQ